MKTNLRFTALFVLTAVTALAQYAPPPPARPFPGFANEKLRTADPYLNAWDVAASVRVRFEDKLGAGFTDSGSNWDFDASGGPARDNNNGYYLTRFMPRVGYTGQWLAFTAEGRGSYSFGDERYGGGAAGKGLAERDGPMDLHQAFVLVGNHKEFPISLKIGRQELLHGDQRLVGPFKWNNSMRTFDAAKVRWQSKFFGVDFFTSGVVYHRTNHLNQSNSQDRFSGAYLNFANLGAFTQKNIVETYFYARNVARGIVTDDWSGIAAPFRFPAPQDLDTLGLRVKSKPNAFDPWDYGAELMGQSGHRTAVFPATTVAAALAAPRLDQQAYAWVLQGGYTWTASALQPRLALIDSYGSGDKSSADGSSNTFQNLFPTNHLFYGYMDLSSLQNLHDIRLAFTLKPTTTSIVALEAHAHYLNRTTDFWYNVAGVPRNVTTFAPGSGRSYRINPTYGRHVGNELDLVGAWTFTPSTQIEAAACRYFRSDYIKQSLSTVGSKDASYVYVQLTLNL